MGHSNSLQNVPDVNSDEFKQFIKAFNYDVIDFNDHRNNFKENDKMDDAPKTDVSGSNALYTKHPAIVMAILLGVFGLLSYSFSVGMISRGVFKGNLKFYKYLMNA